MKTRNAAALVLVVWYLMYPPMDQKGMPSKEAPLQKWGLLNSSKPRIAATLLSTE